MRRRSAVAVTAVALLVGGCSAAGSSSGGSAVQGEEVQFSGFVGGPGIITQTEDAIKVFNTENPGHRMTFVQGQLNQPPFQQLMAMYASGNVPTIFVVDAADVAKVADKVVDLSDQKWVQEQYPWLREQGTVGGKVLAAPQGTTGVGFLYNKKLVDAAVGGTFDPATIRTRSDLAALFEKIKATGTAPVQVSPLTWSLGAHFLGKLYDAQGDAAARARFISQLRAGTADVAGNKVFNGLMDTLDLMLKYNLNAAKPIAGSIETDSKSFVDGKAALWFMGDFQWPTLAGLGASADGDGYGILPVPISDDAADPWNQKIMTTSSFMMAIDKTVATPQQQAGAKAYLEWYVHSTSGQDFMVNKAGAVPAYTTVKLPPNNPLGRAVADRLAKGQTYGPVLDLPADHLNVLGDVLVKHVAGKVDRAGVATAITDYWKKQK